MNKQWLNYIPSHDTGALRSKSYRSQFKGYIKYLHAVLADSSGKVTNLSNIWMNKQWLNYMPPSHDTGALRSKSYRSQFKGYIKYLHAVLADSSGKVTNLSNIWMNKQWLNYMPPSHDTGALRSKSYRSQFKGYIKYLHAV